MQTITSSVFSFLFFDSACCSFTSNVAVAVALRVRNLTYSAICLPSQAVNGARFQRKLEVGFQCRCLPNAGKGKVSKDPTGGLRLVAVSQLFALCGDFCIHQDPKQKKDMWFHLCGSSWFKLLGHGSNVG